MDGKSVSQRMGRQRLHDAAPEPGETTRPLHGSLVHRVTGTLSGKEPGRRSRGAPPVAQVMQQRRREHHVAIALPFAAGHMDHHAVTVDVGDLQVEDFREP